MEKIKLFTSWTYVPFKMAQFFHTFIWEAMAEWAIPSRLLISLEQASWLCFVQKLQKGKTSICDIRLKIILQKNWMRGSYFKAKHTHLTSLSWPSKIKYIVFKIYTPGAEFSFGNFIWVNRLTPILLFLPWGQKKKAKWDLGLI